MDRDEMSTLYRRPPIDASYQVSVHLAQRFQRRRIFKISQSETRSFRGEEFLKSANQKQESPVVAMFVNGSGRNEQSLQRTFHRCFLPSFGSFGQAVSEEKIKKNRPIRNKNCLWRPCLLTDRDKMSSLNRGPSIDASYQVSDHLAKRFQMRRFLEIDQSETKIACGGHVC